MGKGDKIDKPILYIGWTDDMKPLVWSNKKKDVEGYNYVKYISELNKHNLRFLKYAVTRAEKLSKVM